MSDVSETPDSPDAEALADELGLGIELSPEEQVQADEMVAHLRSQFGLDSDQDAEPDPVDEAAEAPEDEEDVQGPEPEAEPQLASHAPASDRLSIDGREYIVIDGVPYSVDEIRAAQQRRPEPEPVSAPPEPPKPPEWLDLDDPSQRFFWEQNQRQAQAIQGLQANQQQMVQDQTRAKLTTEVEAGLHSFRTSHPELTEDDVQTIRLHATALNIVGGLAQTMDGPAAVRKALDIAYLDHPEYRAKHQGEPTPTEVKAEKAQARKAKLGALSGNSGSGPRQPEAPQKPNTDREMRAQAAKWLSEQGII